MRRWPPNPGGVAMAAPASVIVLGSTGMLGQALLREAARRSMPCTGFARGAPGGGALDLTDDKALARALRRVPGPADSQVIVNAAALTDLEACERDPARASAINTRLPGELAAHCQRSGRTLVQISTDHFHTGGVNNLHDERCDVELLNHYARSKFAGEARAAECSGSLIVRTNIIGLRGWAGRPTFVEWALDALHQGRPFTAFEDVYASSIEVGQFSIALFDLIAQRATGLLNVAARDAVSKATFIRALAQALGLDHRHCQSGSHTARPGVPRANALGLDVCRAERLLKRRLPDHSAVVAELALRLQGVAHASQ